MLALSILARMRNVRASLALLPTVGPRSIIYEGRPLTALDPASASAARSSSSTADAAALRQQLRWSGAALPVSQAVTLPSAWYTDPRVLEQLEKDSVFFGSWQVGGRHWPLRCTAPQSSLRGCRGWPALLEAGETQHCKRLGALPLGAAAGSCRWELPLGADAGS